MVSHEGPSESTRQNTTFKAVFFSEGWKEKAEEPADQHVTPPNKKMVVEVTPCLHYEYYE